ncbi:hypothetical protein IU433_30955 [Nocardia puris]|uniref:Uncharacterized protein n=1 Tax=Nocardia puris TaxID=208602 RepID=A0A366CZ30_9NOCA|nr:hypothetical protein [Nocardia puris]MBF6215251.1 hypothetical protein [Nocardia puris]MBF6369699.1 hypothetical protein [Nocardia puris]MBF6463421.1 hypothetical protein [Nocardia puris]RBO82915.1 hypothetical protein DFR74_1215 [Nocardia puris]
MTTPTPRPHGPGTPGSGPHAPRPGAPLPGQHLPGAQGRPEPADPDRVRAEIDELLAELNAGRTSASPESAEAGTDITRRAHILEQAHDVLVRALATVDKI